MNLLSLLSFYNAFMFLVISIYVIAQNPQAKMNRVVSLLNLSFFFWCMPVTFFYVAASEEEAWFWLKFSAIGWCLFSAFMLHFILILTGRDGFLNSRIRLAAFYLVPATALATTLVLPGTPLADEIVQSGIGWGWTNRIVQIGPRWVLFAAYIAVCGIAGLALLPGWARRSRNAADKRFARIVLVTDGLMMVIGFATDILLPTFTTLLPPLANLFCFLFAFTLSQYVLRYSFLSRHGIISSDQMLDTIQNPVVLLDAGGRIVRCNDATGDFLGLPPKRLIDREWAAFRADGVFEARRRELTDKGELRDMECDFRTATGELRHAVYNAMTLQDANLGFAGFVLSLQDISERRALEIELEKSRNESREAADELFRIAHFDTLTGLPNRRLFFQRVMQNIVAHELDQTDFAVVFMDLNGFKRVNDDFGHDVGDRLLVESANRLREFCGARDLLARMGGDEFVMILSGVGSLEEANVRIRAIQRRFRDEIRIEGIRCDVGIAAGAALYSEHGDLDAMLRMSDLAMYEDKKREKEARHGSFRSTNRS